MFHLSSIDTSLLTICPYHRDTYGIRWRTGKTRCAVPEEFSVHVKGKLPKGNRGISLSQSRIVYGETGKLIPIGSRKDFTVIPYICMHVSPPLVPVRMHGYHSSFRKRVSWRPNIVGIKCQKLLASLSHQVNQSSNLSKSLTQLLNK